MNDKRDEIERILTEFNMNRCVCLSQECGLRHEGKCLGTSAQLSCAMQALNPLVVIPVEGELPNNRLFQDMQQAGWVKFEKLVKG